VLAGRPAGDPGGLRADFLTVVPGLRPPTATAGDQKRIATPAEAWAAGADIPGDRPADHRRARSGAAARDILASLKARP
jgi:orotidine-5'-phosphate decarboxylase